VNFDDDCDNRSSFSVELDKAHGSNSTGGAASVVESRRLDNSHGMEAATLTDAPLKTELESLDTQCTITNCTEFCWRDTMSTSEEDKAASVALRQLQHRHSNNINVVVVTVDPSLVVVLCPRRRHNSWHDVRMALGLLGSNHMAYTHTHT
jgi:hypothetical protein